MLAARTDFLLENQTAGAGLSLNIYYRRWKFDSTGGLIYEDAQSPFAIANNVDDSVSGPSGNFTNEGQWLGMHANVEVAVNVGGGDWFLYLANDVNATATTPTTAQQTMLVAGTGSTLVYQFEL